MNSMFLFAEFTCQISFWVVLVWVVVAIFTWFDKFKIDTSAEIHRVAQAVREALYAFKNAKIQARLLAIQELLNPENTNYTEEKVVPLMHEQIQLLKIKRTFAKELGRIII